jgi:hypothetical protein
MPTEAWTIVGKSLAIQSLNTVCARARCQQLPAAVNRQGRQIPGRQKAKNTNTQITSKPDMPAGGNNTCQQIQGS